MATVFAFVGMWLISLVVAMLVALQLGDFFGANDEFPLVIATLIAFVTATMAVFALAYAVARHVRILHGVALVLALAAFWPVFAPGLVQAIARRSINPGTVGIENGHIVIELVIAGLLAVLVQWGLVRRRWLRAAALDDFTRWPWVATVIGGLVVLNPAGLGIIGTALRRSQAEVLWGLWATVAAGAALVLVVMTLIECYIRRRILRRRLAPAKAGHQPIGNGEVSG
jgi:hypothetical protein